MTAEQKGKRRARAVPPGAAPVTVAIATYNRAGLLARALASCRDQSVKPERVIVVNDGSTDDTEEVVRAFEGLPIHYVDIGKIGLGHARNLATALCTTPWLCIHDDDDIMLPNRLRDHVEDLSRGANMSHGGWINFNDRGELDYHPGKPIDENVAVYVGNAITHGACCYEAAVLREFPYRTDVFGGADFDVAVRAVRSGIRCVHTGSYVLLRQKHDISISGQARAHQAATRRAVVGAIDFHRSDEEIAVRTASARTVAELQIEEPSLADITRVIGAFRGRMRVVARISRSAGPLFALLDKAAAARVGLELFDPGKTLAAQLVVASEATVSDATLARSRDQMVAWGLKPTVVSGEADLFDVPREDLVFENDSGARRAVLLSESLRELRLVHRILGRARRLDWMVAIHGGGSGAERRRLFTLVSAPIRRRPADVEGAPVVDDLARLIAHETDLSPRFLQDGRLQ